MKKYNYQYDVAKMYLSHLIEVEESNSNNPKIKKLKEIKEELDKENILIKNPYFKEYLNNKKIAIFNNNNFSNLEQKIITKLSKTNEIYYYEEEKEIYIKDNIIEFITMEEEVSYIASEISRLLKENISIKNIKIYANNEYISTIKRILTWFKIKIDITSTSIYNTKIGQDFLKNLKTSKEETIKLIESNYSLKNEKNIEIYNQIINILNNYTWLNDLKYLKIFLKEDFQNTKIKRNTSILIKKYL